MAKSIQALHAVHRRSRLLPHAGESGRVRVPGRRSRASEQQASTPRRRDTLTLDARAAAPTLARIEQAQRSTVRAAGAPASRAKRGSPTDLGRVPAGRQLRGRRPRRDWVAVNSQSDVPAFPRLRARSGRRRGTNRRARFHATRGLSAAIRAALQLAISRDAARSIDRTCCDAGGDLSRRSGAGRGRPAGRRRLVR
jgi:hypothetical protein